MTDPVHLDLDDRIALISMGNPPVTLTSQAVRAMADDLGLADLTARRRGGVGPGPAPAKAIRLFQV